MRILGIETSCDETAAAVVQDGTKILSNVVASSAEMHVKTGGIIPESAAREQIKSIIPVIDQALVDSIQPVDHSSKNAVDRRQSAISTIDAIAVTFGPGLIGSLLVGVETAKTLAYIWNKPIIPVNHLVGHIYANWISDEPVDHRTGEPKFPLLALVVSGGHTDLVLMKGHGNIKWISGTRDDAAGEAFDKCARLLDLPYPGGPSISASAANFHFPSTNFQLKMFPRPLINENTLDWSFSGLKTAVARETKNLKLNTENRNEMAAEIQEAIVDVLVSKTIKAVERYKPKSLLISGGVAANKRLREKLDSRIKILDLGIKLYIPEANLCTDNASAIASTAFFNNRATPWEEVTADPELTIIS